MILEPEQRAAFMRWLQSEIDSDNMLIKQMKQSGMVRIMIENKTIESAAKMTVLNVLRHSVTGGYG